MTDRLQAGIMVRACNLAAAALQRTYPDGTTYVTMQEFATVMDDSLMAAMEQVIAAQRAREEGYGSSSDIGGLDVEPGGRLPTPELRREG